MEITIKGTTGKDFPALINLSEDKKKEFYIKLDASVRRRLELKPDDTVRILIDEGYGYEFKQTKKE